MDFLNKEIGKKSKLPSKKSTMNLYQPDLKDDPRKLIIAGIVVLSLLVAVMSKFFIIDGLLEIKYLKTQIADDEMLYAQMQQRYQGYGALKEEYYRYSENFSSDEERLVDRIVILSLLDEVTSGVVKVTDTTISGNKVTINVTTSNLNQISKLRENLESRDMVKNVVVYSANKGDGDLTSTISFECHILEEE